MGYDLEHILRAWEGVRDSGLASVCVCVCDGALGGCVQCGARCAWGLTVWKIS